MQSRREYLSTMRTRYRQARSRSEKSQILDELQETLGYARKYAIAAINAKSEQARRRQSRTRPLRYQAAMPVIQMVWEALDYPCAERLYPVLVRTAEQLARHGEIRLTPEVLDELRHISRATLARRMAKWDRPKAKHVQADKRPVAREIPVERCDWDEARPGALEIDLVEHNGGSSTGHYAYTLSVVDIVTGYSRRLAVLGRGQGRHCKGTGAHSDGVALCSLGNPQR
ncbi:Integrase catalytic region (fragment) [Kyrpidia spormannii]|uniref:Integrase catalytic region n=2 Tax=Kyrpidia spormannii TaxID=2055160 RepID=A0ACA8Z7F1_9BACL